MQNSIYIHLEMLSRFFVCLIQNEKMNKEKDLKQVASRNRINRLNDKTKGKLKQNRSQNKRHMAIKESKQMNENTPCSQ